MKIYENSCRVCLVRTESKDKDDKWISIEEKDSDDLTICDKITICTGININCETLLAKSICQPCTEHLRSAFEFQKICKQSDTLLQDYIKNNICTTTTKLKVENTDESLHIACFPDVKVEIKSSSSDENEDSDLKHDNSPSNDTEEQYKPTKNSKQNPISRKRSNNSDKYKTLVPLKKLARNRKPTNCNNKVEQNLVNESIFSSDIKPIEERKKRKKSKKYENEPFICELCGNVYKKRALSSHMRWHRGEKEYQCEICKKTFLLATYLARHMKTHTGIRNIQCSFCTRTFYTNGHKRAHEKVHTGEQQYLCKLCDRSFSYSQTLRRHMMIHSGIKPFKCDDCGKEFRQENHLQRHLLVHSGMKPFKCNDCGKGFRQETHLKQHLLTNIHLAKTAAAAIFQTI